MEFSSESRNLLENKIKLLLVEDDSMLTYVVKSSLEGLIGGYEVITAVNLSLIHI